MTSIAIDMTDGLSSSTAIKGPCRVATTANITLSGLQTIDGIALAAGDRVLVKNQTTGSQNGIWIADTGTWRRSKDFNKTRDVRKGTQILITDGTINASSGWYVSTEDPIDVGTTAIVFTQNILLNGAALVALEAAAAASAADAATSETAAETAETNAEAAEAVATGLASSFILSENTFDTKATAAAWSPVAAPNFIRTAGALAADDGSGVVFVQGSGNGGFSINLSGGGSQAYKPAKERGYDIRLFGAGPARTAAQNTAALLLARSYTTELWVPPLDAGEYFDVDEETTLLDHTKIRGAGWHSRIRQTARTKNIFISGDHCSFEGLHLIGDNLLTGADFTKNNGIYASGKHGVTVQNCFGEKFEGCGVQLRGCKDYKVVNNTFFANPWGSFATSGDIVIYSFADAGRGVISGNSCLSNNSQGIYADVIGYDADIIIANNIVVTLDPATCIEGGAWTEAVGDYAGTPASVRRRHGIGVGYNSSNVDGPRSTIIGNICRNTRWTGIYKQGFSAAGGGVLIIGNRCSKNGLEQANSLNGGIYVNATGEDVVSGNMISDFQSTGAGVGGITITAGTAPTRPTKIHGNLISNSMGQGISVGTHAAYIDIDRNEIVGSATTDIFISNSAAAGNGGHTIRGNMIKRTSGNNINGIRIATPTTSLITTVEGNYIEGFDNSNADAANAGISTNNPLVTRVLRNHIKNFNVAVTSTVYFTAGTRYVDQVLEGNIIEDCTSGFGLASTTNTAVVPVVGNRFINVTNKTAAGSTATGLAGTKCGYICRKDNDRLVVLELTAAPTVGTWAAGDRCEFVAPATWAAAGTVCSVAGNPGTWA